MMTTNGLPHPDIVKCGHCGGECIRLAAKHLKEARPDLPLVYTRTLVGNRFLPSCSKPCAEALRPVPTKSPYAI